MSGAFPTIPDQSLELRRAELERTRDAAAQSCTVYGEIEVSDIGEAQQRIVFPVYFVNKPLPRFTSELGYGSPTATPGNFPTCNVVILTWDYRLKTDGSFLYVGALLGIVTTGAVGQVTNVHWSMEGIGLRSLG